jgi:hypothetical protein
MDAWYYAKGNRQVGPLDIGQLRQALAGKDASRVLVWRQGYSEWIPASRIPELATVAPPPLPQLDEYVPSKKIRFPKEPHMREPRPRKGIGFLGWLALIIFAAWIFSIASKTSTTQEQQSNEQAKTAVAAQPAAANTERRCTQQPDGGKLCEQNVQGTTTTTRSDAKGDILSMRFVIPTNVDATDPGPLLVVGGAMLVLAPLGFLPINEGP